MADDMQGGLRSPGGFIFGVQGFSWGEPRPTTITFFLDNTAMVCDQHGRPIRGTVVDGKEVKFATSAPSGDRDLGVQARMFATHAQVVAALEAERVQWRSMSCAGWPQLPYVDLKAVYGKDLADLPPTPIEELARIRDSQLRRDAIRARREYDDIRAKELAEMTEPV